jgi:putative oxidoreductase
MRFGLVLLRAVIGGLFFGHGTQKLAGWFGGRGLEGTAESFESMELSPGVAHASAAGLGEAGGGALVALGLATPLGAAAITASMLTAIRKVHGPKGVWVTEGGYEYNLVLIACMFALTEQGPGRLSLDALRGRERWGTGWALAELGAGAAGSALAIGLAERRGQGRAGAPAGDGAAADGAGAGRQAAAREGGREDSSNVRPLQPAGAAGAE